jgi:hypothetical protein
VLRAALPPQPGSRELCLYFTRRAPDPLWVVERVELVREQLAFVFVVHI